MLSFLIRKKKASYELTSATEGSVNELGCWVEVDTHVERGRVVGFNAVIRDVHASIMLRTASPFALGTVEDVRDPELDEFFAVWGNFSANDKWEICTLYWQFLVYLSKQDQISLFYCYFMLWLMRYSKQGILWFMKTMMLHLVCVCVCVGMFMWFMRTQICIMTWVWHRYYKEKVIYEDICPHNLKRL